jgi:predicted DCC family thiol-disulfide oxidoreductase YuxK
MSRSGLAGNAGCSSKTLLMCNEQNPPGVSHDDHIVLFDGVCKLCSFWARFLIRHDREQRYKLATVQSEEGKAILSWAALPTSYYDTLVYVHGGKFYVRSTAVIKIVAGLPFPWRFAVIAWLIPKPLRDWIYDRIAQNRYSIFGKYDRCVLPEPDHMKRFLNAK